MNSYQTLLAIRDAMAADDLGAAEAALEKHCIAYSEFVDEFGYTKMLGGRWESFNDTGGVLGSVLYKRFLQKENFKR